MQGWARRAAAIAKMSSAQDALSRFDEVENAVAKFEDELKPFMIAMDREIQDHIDWLRGK
jgi:hypothetical protein